MSVASELMNSPTKLMRAASSARGIDSMALAPFKFVANLAGKAGEKLGLKAPSKVGLGDHLMGRYVINPTESLVNKGGQVMGELPLIGGLFKHKLSPDDILEAAKRTDFSPDQIGKLTQQAHAGELSTHRLTAPLESKFTKMFVLPAMGAMYLQEKLDQRQKERIVSAPYRAQQASLAKSRLGNVRNMAGIKTASKRNTAMANQGNATFIQQSYNQDAMMKQASSTISSLTSQLDQATMIINTQQKELSMYKHAALLASEGGLDPDQIAPWVAEQVKQTKQAMHSQSPVAQPVSNPGSDGGAGMLSLFTQASSTIPEHAKIGSLAPGREHSSRSSSGGNGVKITARRAGLSAAESFNESLGLQGL